MRGTALAMRRLALGVTFVAAGCATGGGPRAPSPPAVLQEAPYLVSPLRGYPLAVSERLEGELLTAHADLVARRDPALARAQAAALLERQPGLHPAIVLLAEADLVERSWEAARDRVVPVVQELPGYSAAQVVLGRSAERLGDLPEALDAYHAASDVPAAAQRAAELLPRTIEIVGRRVDDAIDRGRYDEARSELERLETWAPEAPATLEAGRRLAEASGDRTAELASLRRLAADPDAVTRGILVRLADLELDVGEPSAGLRILQDLAAATPSDRELAESLARAKFRFRVALLPPRARALVSVSELSRGDFAAMLYWLFPSVRYGRGAGATIANDVFDHPSRDEIVRVVNQELMRVDPNLHQFHPDRSVRRRETLRSILTLLDRSRPRPACLGAQPLPWPVSTERVCELAARCGLIPEPGDCLPEGPVSGSEVVEMSRTALAQLGIE